MHVVSIKNSPGCWASVAHAYILATWEAEIRRIAVQGQPGQEAQEIPSQPTAGLSGMSLLSKLHGDWDQEDFGSRASQAK
jgi:hypothetical protein